MLRIYGKSAFWTGLLLTFLMLINTVLADIVKLKNGDQITGEITYLEGDLIFIQTDYAGVIKINSHKVASFSILNPSYVKAGMFDKGRTAESITFHETLPTGSKKKRAEPRTLTLMSGEDVLRLPYKENLLVARINDHTPIYQDFRMSGMVDLALDFDKNSTTSALYKLGGSTRIQHGFWRHTVKGSVYRKEDDSKTKKHYYTLNYAVDRFFTDRFFWQGSIDYKHDWIEDIREDFSVGTGPGWQVWDNEHSALSFATLINYQALKYQTGETSKDPQLAIKWDFHNYFLNKSFRFDSAGRLGRSINNNVSLDLTLDASLSYQLTNSLSLKTGLNYEKIKGKEGNSSERTLTIGLGYWW
ncbi:MAG: DUF481 domain-containing protein [Xanthomonadaceae bacterium]|nr:DUF481 domain-containing protein [Xanthomonadaceae bacterium]